MSLIVQSFWNFPSPAMDLLQHVTQRTHMGGHTLALIITHVTDHLVKSTPLSDHFLSVNLAILFNQSITLFVSMYFSISANWGHKKPNKKQNNTRTKY